MRFIIIFLLLINLYADSDHHSYRHINKELSHLNLTADQTKQIKEILKEFRTELRAYRDLKEEIEDKRKDIFLKEVFDVKELNRLNLRLDTKAHEIENQLLKKVHTILNLKQRIEFIHYFDDWEVE